MKIFNYAGFDEEVEFQETTIISDEVSCDVYTFATDDSKDLAIVTIRPGGKTPQQKILSGDKTIEGYVSGSGLLIIKKETAVVERHNVNESRGSFSITLNVGDTMQWIADQDSKLVIYEVCLPPYEDGRFEDLGFS